MPVLAADRDQRFNLTVEFGEERFDRAVQDIEDGLTFDDPRFVRRMQGRARGRSANAVTIVALLVAAALLLTIGVAVLSWYAFVAGALAFIAAFAVDDPDRPGTGPQNQPVNASAPDPDSGPSSVGRRAPSAAGFVTEVVP